MCIHAHADTETTCPISGCFVESYHGDTYVHVFELLKECVLCVWLSVAIATNGSPGIAG